MLFALPAVQAGDPIELARGLRDNDLADLALEYLNDLEATKPNAAVLAVIPLERARAKLVLAEDEADAAKRTRLVAEAKLGFDDFLTKNPTHPRRAEAALSLARLVSVQAKGMLSAAAKLDNADETKKQRVAARAVFKDAAKRFGTAATEFAKKVDEAGLPPAARKLLQTDLFQAKLDQAINLFQLADTYPSSGPAVTANDTIARGKAIDEAKVLFSALSAEDAKQPLPWIAKAWVGECEREKNNFTEAQKRFDEVKKAAQAESAAQAGARVARFFELRAEFLKGGGTAGFRRTQGLIEAWLLDGGRSPKPTPELYAARYYLAKTKELQAAYKYDDKTKQITFGSSAKELLTAAEKDYRKLADPENDYTARAAEDRTKVIRVLIGDPSKLDPAKQTDFDFCLMAAQVQLYNTIKEIPADKEAERKASALKVVAFYERLAQLPVPKDLAREATDAQAKLVYAYILAGRPYEAAVLGEHLARTLRSQGTAALAGLYAVNAYRQSAGKADETDVAARASDGEKAVALGFFLDRTFPQDPNTDAVRVQVGQQLLQTRRWKEAFDLTSHIGAGSAMLWNGRFFQSLAAYELLRPAAPGTEATNPLAPAEKADIYRKIVADLTALPALPADASPNDARLAVLTYLQLAEMYFLAGTEELPKAEAAAAEAAKKMAPLLALTPADKQELGFRIELTRMRAAYGQGLLAFQAKKFADVFTKIGPTLAEAAKNGAVAKPDMTEAVAEFAKKVDDFRRDRMLGLAIQTRIREGSIDKIGELLDVLKKLGGNLANSAGTLGQLIDGARPQIESLRKEGKAEEADKLVAGIGLILDKVAAEPGVTPSTVLVLGRGLASIGNTDKAVEFLKRIPAPPALDVLKKRASEIPEAEQPVVGRYKLAQLELAKAYRLGKKFAEAEETLKPALPTRDAAGREQPGTGWQANSDFKRESAMLSEAKAEAAAPAEALKLWGEARSKWTEQANQYLVPLRKLAAGKKDEKSAFLALLELRQLPPNPKLPKTDKDIRDGLNEAKPPEWVKELLAPNSLYVAEMRNTITRIETQLKPLYHDLVFESTRCLTQANISILKGDAAKTSAALAKLAKSMVDLEAANPDLAEAVKLRFTDLLDETPALKDEYVKLGGKRLLKP